MQERLAGSDKFRQIIRLPYQESEENLFMADKNSGRAGRRLLSKLLLIPVLCAVLALAFFLGARLGGQDSAVPVITSDLLGQHLRSVQELVSAEYHYTNMGRFENQLDFYGWKVPFTAKHFIVSYDGVIKAGVDFGRIQVEVDEEALTVTVVLPQSEILSHEISEDSIEVFDETSNAFNQITVEDYMGFTQEQKSAMEQRAAENGLLAAASDNARSAVYSLLSAMPGMESYILTVR